MFYGVDVVEEELFARQQPVTQQSVSEGAELHRSSTALLQLPEVFPAGVLTVHLATLQPHDITSYYYVPSAFECVGVCESD